MIISKNTWHYQVFNWQYKESHYGESFEESQIRQLWRDRRNAKPDFSFSLCSYVRAVVIKAPFRWLFTPPRLWFTLVALDLIGLGIVRHFKGVAGMMMLLTITFEIALIMIILSFSAAIWEFFKNRIRGRVPGVVTSFLEVLNERAKAAHEGICPRITFTDKG